MNTPKLSLVLVALLGSLSVARSEVLVHDQFADGNRSSQSQPASVAWYASHAVSGIVGVSAGALVMDTVDASLVDAARALGAHFNSVSLSIGQSIILTFDFECAGALGDTGVAFRAGLFNSQGLANNTFTTDGGNVGNTGVTSRGYAVNLNPHHNTLTGVGAPTVELVERRYEPSGSPVYPAHRFLTSSNAFARLGSISPAFSAGHSLVSGRKVTGRLRIKRTGSDAMAISFEVLDPKMPSVISHTEADASSAVFTFDTVGFSVFSHATSGGIGQVALSNIKVVRTLPDEITHGVVFHQTGTFAAFPANEGSWSWGDEVLVSYNTALHGPANPFHHYSGALSTAFSRSLDGGITWSTESHPEVLPQSAVAVGDIVSPIPEIDFGDPDLVLKTRGMLLYWSMDRGATWSEPHRIPALLDAHVRTRTSYLHQDADNTLWFLTSTRTDDSRGRSYVMRVGNEENAGKSRFNLLSIIGDDPAADYDATPTGTSYSIMPSIVKIDTDRYVAAVRKRKTYDEAGVTKTTYWTGMYESFNGCHDWEPLPDLESAANNPVALVHLGGPKIAAIYGSRQTSKLGMWAKVTSDAGATWSAEIALRGSPYDNDFGYPRAMLRPDGSVLILYYYCTAALPEQHIASTIWYPN